VLDSNGVDILYEIYNQEVLAQIQKKATDKNGLGVLYQILTSDRISRINQRKHLNKWLIFVNEKNGLDQDRLSRLKEPRDFHSWRSVVNEIEVAYFFAKAFNHNIAFVTNSSAKGEGDFVINAKDESIVVEIKTPNDPDHSYTESISGVHHGLDTHLIKKSFIEAARQLKRGNINLVVICTQLCDWIREIPDSFIEYLFGAEQFGQYYSSFDPCGEFVKHKRKRYTRISAIASLDDEINHRNFQRFQFSLYFNKDAAKPLDINQFPNTEQFVLKNGRCSIHNEDEIKRNFRLID
jgi:hypothetical protein